MSDDRNEAVAFDAIRQFVVAPDRRYRIEQQDDALVFLKTGSQFDTQWLARGARARLGDRAADAFERSSPRKLVLGGIGVAVGSALLLAVIGISAADTAVVLRRPQGIGVLFLAFTVGLVMIIAGIASRRGNANNPGHDFSLPLSDIVDATVLPAQSELARRGEPQVARVHLQPSSGRPIKLGIPTDSDLETIKTMIPRLAA